MAIDLKFSLCFQKFMKMWIWSWELRNIFKLEGVKDSCDSCFSFLNRSIPFFPKEKREIKAKEQMLVMVEAPFVEEISGMAVVEVLDMHKQVINMIKLKIYKE